MAILVVADYKNGSLKDATLSAVTAASQIGGEEIDILVVGSDVSNVVEAAASISGVTKVLKVENAIYENILAENIAPLIADIVRERKYSYVISPATTTGKDFMPRVAALLDVAQISDIVSVVSSDSFIRPIYAGNALETVQSSDSVKVITVRATAFDKASLSSDSSSTVSVEDIAAGEDAGLSKFISRIETKSDRPDLSSAKIVVSGGRGVGSKDNFAIIEKLADKLGAAVGASRAAVDAGYVPNDYQVGQTGKIVAPELYIAAGISGAIQHVAGMKDSKVIVAINKDDNAPIFEIADYGIVADMFDVIPELTDKL